MGTHNSPQQRWPAPSSYGSPTPGNQWKPIGGNSEPAPNSMQSKPMGNYQQPYVAGGYNQQVEFN